jgi:hypothetical protein
MRASSLHVQGRAFNEPRSSLAKSEGRMPGDRTTGVCFFRLPFFAQAKKGDTLACKASGSSALKIKTKQELDDQLRC